MRVFSKGLVKASTSPQTSDKPGDPAVLDSPDPPLQGKEIRRRDFLANLTTAGSLGAVATIPTDLPHMFAAAVHLLCRDIQSVTTMSDLRQLEPPNWAGTTDPSLKPLFWLAGHRRPLDGGQGYFWWDVTSAATDDGGLTIGSTTTAAGRWHRVSSSRSISVKWFGAAGDGVQDDREAFERWCDALMRSVRAEPLHGLIPPGTYRIGRRMAPRFTDQFAREGAITLNGASNVTIEFVDATLLVDNLNGEGRGDQFHGIVVRGPASNIALINPRVEWKTRPTARSQGDGIRFYGFPDDKKRGANGVGLISKVTILGSRVRWAPQAGLLMCGCSEVYISRHESVETRADGFHLNACRRVTCDVVIGERTGDDACALVTYFDPADNTYRTLHSENEDNPYTCRELGEWSNSTTRIHTVIAKGGGANGCRLAGAHDVEIDQIIVEGKLKALVADAGLAGGPWGWSYLASTRCRVTRVVATRCAVGVQVQTFNVEEAVRHMEPWKFDLSVEELQAHECSACGVNIDRAAGVTAGLLRLYNCCFRSDDASNIAIDTLTVEAGDNASVGSSVLRGAANTLPFQASRLPTQFTLRRLVARNVAVIEFQDLTGFAFELIETAASPGSGVVFLRCKDVYGERIAVIDPAQRQKAAGTSCALALLLVENFTLSEYYFQNTSASEIKMLEVGGGSASGGVSKDIRIERIVSDQPASGFTSSIVIQGGPYKPINLSYNLAPVSQSGHIER